MAIYTGVDVSQFQGAINWSVLNTQVSFAFIKSSGGDYTSFYTDSRFAYNQAQSRAVGMPRGFYHFGSNGQHDAASEANYFTSVIGGIQNGEVIILDTETTSFGFGINPTWCKAFLDQVATNVGFKPMIYMSQSPANTLNWTAVAGAGYKLWVADYAVSSNNFSLPVGAFGTYNFLQYSSSGVVNGIPGRVDMDSFNSGSGGIEQFSNYGKGGGAVVVVNNTAQVGTNSSYAQSNQQTIHTPKESYDQIIYSTTINTTVTNTVGNYSGIYTLNSGSNQLTYPIGVFSYDGGTTYIDYGFILGAPGTPTSLIPSVTVQINSNVDGTVSFDASVNSTVGGGGTIPLILHVALLASSSPATLKKPQIAQKLSYSNIAKINDPTKAPYSVYRRISADRTLSSTDLTFAHGLSSIPNLMYWSRNPDNGTAFMGINQWANDGPEAAADGIRADGTNVQLHLNDPTGNQMYYRVYKDNR